MKFISSVVTALLISSNLAYEGTYKCEVVDGRVKGADGKDQYVFNCKCTADYYGRSVEMSCGSTSDKKETSCKSEYTYSADKWVNAAIVNCQADSVTLRANANRGGSEDAHFALACEYQAYSRVCKGGNAITESAKPTTPVPEPSASSKPKCTKKY